MIDRVPEYGNRKFRQIEYGGKVGVVVNEPSARIVIAEFDDGTRIVSVSGCRFVKEMVSGKKELTLRDILKKYGKK